MKLAITRLKINRPVSLHASGQTQRHSRREYWGSSKQTQQRLMHRDHGGTRQMSRTTCKQEMQKLITAAEIQRRLRVMLHSKFYSVV
ncbi:hypothetical protein DXM26_05835 [Agrobacterium tumefaciens]|uniref:Uncharacterized protein n=1 Tax=Agrobacterium tumefaciens TaxID=358 RepID=A0AB36ETG9_AGRTU|nr:hypothetical protein DXM26_05835 [Agrobacterium tumefaciens]OCJ42866.1 hypothetical protein A6U91_03280 [Agrobacterium tumefaciens]OCJ56143.1 hypothetical protein A6U94_03885 [Agrobacterium tumefaciens]